MGGVSRWGVDRVVDGVSRGGLDRVVDGSAD